MNFKFFIFIYFWSQLFQYLHSLIDTYWFRKANRYRIATSTHRGSGASRSFIFSTRCVSSNSESWRHRALNSKTHHTRPTHSDGQTDWRGQNVRQRTYWTCMVGFGQLKQGQAHSGWGWGRQAPTGQPSFLEGQRSRSSRIITHLFMLIFQTIFIINQLAIKFCIVFLPGCILRNKMNINKNNAFVLYSLDIYAGNSKLFYECNLKINKC